MCEALPFLEIHRMHGFERVRPEGNIPNWLSDQFIAPRPVEHTLAAGGGSRREVRPSRQWKLPKE